MNAGAPVPQSGLLLALRDINIERNGMTVLDISEMDIASGEILAVIGPNGAGKSTLLMAISGLLPVSKGDLFWEGQPVDAYHSLAYRRRLALVLQAPLLTQDSVFANVATGLRFRGVARAEVARRVNHWLTQLGIAHLKDRPAVQLSGGEAQRVSLARALALEPRLLLLDEPFSALDSPTRLRLLEDLKLLLKHTQVTTVFVTHDLDEALFLGDRVAVLMAGQLRQIGRPEEVFTAPSDPEVAHFVGVETLLAGKVIAAKDGLLTVDVAGHILLAAGQAAPGRAVLLCLRPEDITLHLADHAVDPAACNCITGKVSRLSPQGPLLKVSVEGDVLLVAFVTRTAALEMALNEGVLVTATFKAQAAHVIARPDGFAKGL